MRRNTIDPRKPAAFAIVPARAAAFAIVPARAAAFAIATARAAAFAHQPANLRSGRAPDPASLKIIDSFLADSRRHLGL